MEIRQSIIDDNFGYMKFSFDDSEKVFYLEKEIDLGYHKNITLTIINETNSSTQNQFQLLSLIRENLKSVLESAEDQSKDYEPNLLKEYFIERIEINSKNNEWELFFVKKNGFEYCIIEFNELNSLHVSFSA